MDRLTNLFKDIAVAVEENEEFVRSTFGQEAVVDAVTGLQQVQINLSVSCILRSFSADAQDGPSVQD